MLYRNLMMDLLIGLIVSCLFPNAGMAQVDREDWPRWMGPGGASVWRDTGIIDRFPESGPKIVWRRPIHGGYTGPAVAGQRLYVTDWVRDENEPNRQTRGIAETPGTERIVCLDIQTGEPVWTHEHRTTYRVAYGSGPRATPFIDGDRVYSLGTMGHLICLQADDGQLIWEKELTETYKTKPPIWGYASHPLIVDDLLFCTVGGEGSGVVAFDKMTGQEKWKSLTAEEIGYAPPVVFEAAGRRQLIVWYDVGISGLDLQTGEPIWMHPFPANGSPQRPCVSIATPRIIGNHLYITNFYHGSVLLELAPDHVREVWSTEKDRKHENDLNTVMATPVAKNGYLYGVAGNGEIRCIDLETRIVQWRDENVLQVAGKSNAARGFATLFFIEHQDRFFLFTDQGELVIAKMSPQGLDVIDSAKLLETTGETRGRAYVWCHPAFAHGHMFVRNEEEIICVDLRR